MVSWQKNNSPKSRNSQRYKGVLAMDKKNQIKYINEQRDKKYDRIELIGPKGVKEKIQERAAELGLYNKRKQPNISNYIMQLIEKDLGE